MPVLELQHTLVDLSKRVDSVKEENVNLRTENQILGQYIEKLMATSSIFQSSSPPPHGVHSTTPSSAVAPFIVILFWLFTVNVASTSLSACFFYMNNKFCRKFAFGAVWPTVNEDCS
ncbi:unnamed protein product [Taenia asiatica]|uniref:Short coiled-coil protein n=1 Tax=Taenia asiatica TaxID=60517 RepID=A0A0R3VW54_TAEAS|nr:unnamed protein product [Taenia asiatica]